MAHIERLQTHPGNETERSMQRDAERWRVLRDQCVWMTFISPDLVRLAFRVPVQWTRGIETGSDLDALVDAALAQTNVEITGLL